MTEQTVTRAQISPLGEDGGMWVETGAGTHAILMDREDGEQVWIETDASTANVYARQYGAERAAIIAPDVPTISPDTVVYTAGHNTVGYLPDSDDAAMFATIDDARSFLAGELDQLSDFLAEDEETAELADSVGASSEMVKGDHDGDVAWSVTRHGAWSTHEDTGRGLPVSYWINASTLGEVFGDDRTSDEYLDMCDALSARLTPAATLDAPATSASRTR